jgi:hypothetical protein
MGKLALKSIAMGACLTLAIGNFAACSSSSSPASTGTGGDGGGTGNSSNICPKIAVADIQALLSSAPGTVTENDVPPNYECDTTDLQIQLNTDDADKSTYNIALNTGDADGGAPQNIHQMSGVGDAAYWFGDDDGSGSAIIGSPIVNVHKGSATCFLDATSNDATQFTMPTTSQGTIKNTDADAWAAKAGKVCLDIISAGGG